MNYAVQNQKLTPSRAHSLIEAMPACKILVVGDIMLDRFVFGTVERISPESPVPVLSVRRQEEMLGGAGNTLANLCGLGVQASVLAVVGDDSAGRRLRDMCEDKGIDTSGLFVSSAGATIEKARFLSGHQQLLRTDYESGLGIDDTLAQALIKAGQRAIPDMGAVILSDYGKGTLRNDVIAALITCARDHGVPVIVDPKGHDYARYKGASAVTPNKKELSQAAPDFILSSDEQIEIAARHVIAHAGIQAVIATRSAEGISVIEAQAAAHIPPSHNVEVYDVSGAGDTVIATIAAALAAGGSLVEAGNLANVAGSIVVRKVGTAPIRGTELSLACADSARLQGRGHDGATTLEDAEDQIKRWRSKGLSVGFTNGCFDILHKGHVSYLAEARRACDRLIVALNSDSSVRLLKGEDRPIHDQEARASVLLALASVDMVVIFGAEKAGDDNTAIALLKRLQPDLYFKGGDYVLEDIPEAPSVQAYGGRVEVLQEQKGYSTTKAAQRMKAGKTAA